MEQRTLLAIVLSLFVLLTYNAIAVKQVAKKRTNQEYPQHTEIYRDTNKTSVTTPSTNPQLTRPLPSTAESIQLIDNKYVKIETTTIGGSIKSITLKKFEHKFPLGNLVDLAGYQDRSFTLQEASHDRIVYIFNDGDLEITKRYNINNERQIITADVTVKNVSQMSKQASIDFINFVIDTKNLDEKSAPSRDRSLFEYSISQNANVWRKGNASVFTQKENAIKPGPIDWIGFRDRYFCAIVKPEFTIATYHIANIDDKKLEISTGTTSVNLDPGKSLDYNFLLYFGPQDSKFLKSIQPGFEQIISFSNLSLIDFISKAIITLMRVVHKIIPNWGVSIILMCVLVYLAMYPLTMKGMVSMKKMQALQPKMAQLREQYKNQPQKLNKEIMEIYKKNRVSPFGGCLPLILQMPIFIGLYQALWRSYYLKGAVFLWIKDLAEPDRIFVFPSALPIIGNELNILPILMAIVMFFQQKISMKTTAIADPNQASQQKIMMIFFPIMLGFIFYHFSSGLTLYFTVFYIFSAITQWKMSKVTQVT